MAALDLCSKLDQVPEVAEGIRGRQDFPTRHPARYTGQHVEHGHRVPQPGESRKAGWEMRTESKSIINGDMSTDSQGRLIDRLTEKLFLKHEEFILEGKTSATMRNIFLSHTWFETRTQQVGRFRNSVSNSVRKGIAEIHTDKGLECTQNLSST